MPVSMSGLIRVRVHSIPAFVSRGWITTNHTATKRRMIAVPPVVGVIETGMTALNFSQ